MALRVFDPIAIPSAGPFTTQRFQIAIMQEFPLQWHLHETHDQYAALLCEPPSHRVRLRFHRKRGYNGAFYIEPWQIFNLIDLVL